MPTTMLTDAAIKKYPPAEKGRVEYFDKDYPGFCLRVTDKGGKSFCYYYRVKGAGGLSVTGRELVGPQRRLPLGQFPRMSLKDARKAYGEAFDLVEEAKDPAELRKAERLSQNRSRGKTVDWLIGEYEKYAMRNGGPKKWLDGDVQGKFRKHLSPICGDLSLDLINRAQMRSILRIIEDKSAPTVPKEIIQRASPMFEWAVEEEIIETNPFDGIKRTPDNKRKRFLTDKEIIAFWKATDQMYYPYGPFYKLLLLTGQRLREIGSSSWSEIDRDADIPVFILPPERRKHGADALVVPLSEPALSVLSNVPIFSRGDYVFTTTEGDRPIDGYPKGKARLDRLMLEVLQEDDPGAKLADWVNHDLRRTVETGMAKIGIQPHIYEQVIGHAIKGIEGTYNQYHYLPEKKAALEAWGRYVMKQVGLGDDNVVELSEVR